MRDTWGQRRDSAWPKKTKARLFKSGFLLSKLLIYLNMLAEWTGLEPATPGVTGRCASSVFKPLRRGLASLRA